MRFAPESKVRAYEIARIMELSWSAFEAAAKEVGVALSPLNTLVASEAEELIDALEAPKEVEPLPPATVYERPTLRKRLNRRQRRPQKNLRKTQVYVTNPKVPIRRQTMQQSRHRR